MRLCLITLVCLSSAATAGETTLFSNVAVFDGDKYVPRTSVLIEDGRIKTVGPATSAPDGAKVVDGTGHTLLPGLIDAHIHTWGPMQLQQSAEFGVTTSCDMMTQIGFMRATQSNQKKKRPTAMSDFFSAGGPVTVRGGHGTEYGIPFPVLNSADAAQAFVDERLGEGSDYIKIVYDDGKSMGLSMPTLTKEMLKASIEATHKRKKLAVVHIGDLKSARDVAELGGDAIMHIWADKPIDDGTLAMMKKSGMRVVPTLAVMNGIFEDDKSVEALIADENLKPLITKAEQAALRQKFPPRKRGSNYANAKSAVKRLHEAGVPILVGTDSPNPATAHGVSMHHELQLLVEAGLKPIDALRAATSAPANFFRMKDRGRIAKGLHADLLLVKGNPTKDIKATRAIAAVWKAGVPVDLRKRLANVNETKPESDNGLRLIANFDDKQTKPAFGAGITASTDALFGGSSTCEFAAVDGGANNSKGALRLSGSVRKEQPAFAGIMFSPGDQPMQPADLSGNPVISFYAKGDAAEFQVMLFTRKRGFTPSMKTFKAKADWQQFTFDMKDFDDSDGSDVIGIYIGSGRAGKFELQLDELKLLPLK